MKIDVNIYKIKGEQANSQPTGEVISCLSAPGKGRPSSYPWARELHYIFLSSPLDGGLISRAPKGPLLSSPLDGGLNSRAPKGPYGRAP